MINLQLDSDEGILLQATGVERYGEREDILDEVILTNKSLFYWYETKRGMFAKSETEVEKIPLDSIKVVNGKVQIMRVDHDDYGDVLQILYVNGKREYLMFWEPKRDIPKWMNAINAAITGDDTPIIEEPKKKEKKGGLFANGKKEDKPEVVEKIVEKIVYVEKESFESKKEKDIESSDNVVNEFHEKKTSTIGVGVGAFAAGLKNVMNTAKQTFDEVAKQYAISNQEQMVEGNVNDKATCDEGSIYKEMKVSFCVNCGEKLSPTARFCHGCGAKVSQSTKFTDLNAEKENNIDETSERTEKYVGAILKCAHCGATITRTTVVCQDCGMKVTDANALSSVQDFKNQLMAIEATRKETRGNLFYLNGPADPADRKKIDLIKNYPIPNTIDDILEFMCIASANIDVNISKKTWMNSYSGMGVTSAEMPRVISDAWVAKMKQLYHKAEILFPDDPVFSGIQKIYFDKMAELKIKVK